jgi:hypothetical protein
MVGPVAGAARDIGGDRAGAQHGDADRRPFELVFERFRQRHHRVFGHRIRPLTGAAAVLEAGDRGGIDDVPLLAVLEDGRHEMADAVDHPPQIDADDEFPVRARHLDEAGAVHRHPGIVAGDVEPAELALGRGQGVDHRLLLGHVDAHRHDPLVGAGQGVRRGLDRLLLDVGHHHVGAGLGERGGDGEADAGGGAGDDRGLAGDVLHRSALSHPVR